MDGEDYIVLRMLLLFENNFFLAEPPMLKLETLVSTKLVEYLFYGRLITVFTLWVLPTPKLCIFLF